MNGWHRAFQPSMKAPIAVTSSLTLSKDPRRMACRVMIPKNLAHHLALAGRSDPLFSDDATALIHQVGRGTPRAVNNLAVQALVAAYAAGKAIVDESSARAAVTEVTAE